MDKLTRRCTGRSWCGPLTRGGPGQEQQAELADLDLVAVDQHRGFDRFMIDVSAVEAVEVDEQDLSVLQPKLDVVTADGGVVEEDIAVWMPARRCDRLIEQELGPGVGAAYHEQQRRAARLALLGRNAGFNTFGGRGVQLAEKVEGERVGGVPCAFVRRLGVVVATHLLSYPVGAAAGLRPSWSASGKLPRRPACCSRFAAMTPEYGSSRDRRALISGTKKGREVGLLQ